MSGARSFFSLVTNQLYCQINKHFEITLQQLYNPPPINAMMSKRKQLSALDFGQRKRATTPTPSHSPVPPVIMTAPGGARLAFRISNIPRQITSAEFVHVLDQLPHHGSSGAGLVDGGQQNILGWSFAPAAASADAGKYSTATVTFRSIPTLFQFPDTSSRIAIAEDVYCTVDKHFHGLTPLNFPVQPTVEYDLSIASPRKSLIYLALLR